MPTSDLFPKLSKVVANRMEKVTNSNFWLKGDSRIMLEQYIGHCFDALQKDKKQKSVQTFLNDDAVHKIVKELLTQHTQSQFTEFIKTNWEKLTHEVGNDRSNTLSSNDQTALAGLCTLGARLEEHENKRK